MMYTVHYVKKRNERIVVEKWPGDGVMGEGGKKKERRKEKKYLLVFPGCQDQSNGDARRGRKSTRRTVKVFA